MSGMEVERKQSPGGELQYFTSAYSLQLQGRQHGGRLKIDGLKVHSESFKKDKKEPDGCAKKEGKARKIGMSGDVYKKSVKA